MEASRWGGRIVVLSVLSMLLAVASIALPYYELGYYDAYLMTDLNSGPAETLNGLANATLGLLVIYVAVSLVYIVTVMHGVKWMSLYLGGASCVLAVFTAMYFVFRVGQIADDFVIQHPTQEWAGGYSGGYLFLLAVGVVQFASTVMRGWILGGHVEERRIEYIGDNPDEDKDAKSSPILPR